MKDKYWIVKRTEDGKVLCVIKVMNGSTYKGNYKTDNEKWRYIENHPEFMMSSSTYIKTKVGAGGVAEAVYLVKLNIE